VAASSTSFAAFVAARAADIAEAQAADCSATKAAVTMVAGAAAGTNCSMATVEVGSAAMLFAVAATDSAAAATDSAVVVSGSATRPRTAEEVLVRPWLAAPS
jgi:hypothetical protein